MRRSLLLLLLLTWTLPARAIDCVDYGNGPRWMSTLPLTAGTSTDIAFRGNIAYVGGTKLKVVYLADPKAPRVLYTVQESANEVLRLSYSANRLATASKSMGVELYSTSQPTQPPRQSIFSTPSWAIEVCLAGDYCYVGTQLSGMFILDVSDLANPVQVGHLPATLPCRRIYAQGSYLYVTYGGQNNRPATIYDISDPVNPVAVSGWTNNVWDAVPVGDRLYVGLDTAAFSIYDIADPTQPVLLGTTPATGEISSLLPIGDHVFTLTWSGVDYLDVYADRGTGPWEHVGQATCSFSTQVLRASGNYAYVVGADGLDIFDPSHPEGGASLLGYYETTFRPMLRQVEAGGGYAYVANEAWETGDNVIEILDLSDVLHPQRVNWLLYEWTYPTDFVLRGDLLYVADGSGIQVVDVSDPPNPVQVGHVNTLGTSFQLAFHDDLLEVAVDNRGLQVFSIADDPTTPVSRGHINFDQASYAIATMGSLALVLVAGGTLKVADVSDPVHPVEIGQIGGLLFASNIAVRGSIAFVDGDAAIHVIDLSDPTAPVELSQVSIPGGAEALVAWENSLYVATYTWGMRVLDIEDPSQPFYLGEVVTGSSCEGVAVYDDVVLLGTRARLDVAPLDCGLITAAPAGAPPAPLRLAAQPNPFNPSTRIHFSLDAPAPVTLSVHDPAGRRLRTLLAAAPRAAGPQALDWDGRDDAGHPLASGVYLLRLEAGEARAAGKVTLLR